MSAVDRLGRAITLMWMALGAYWLVWFVGIVAWLATGHALYAWAWVPMTPVMIAGLAYPWLLDRRIDKENS